MCSANLCNTLFLPPRSDYHWSSVEPPMELSFHVPPSWPDYSASVSFTPPLVPFVSPKEVGRDGGDCKVGSLGLEETLLASCYFCIPVNRVWNPICLFATASKLPPQPTSPRYPPSPRVARAALLRSSSVYIHRVHPYTRARTCTFFSLPFLAHGEAHADTKPCELFLHPLRVIPFCLA